MAVADLNAVTMSPDKRLHILFRSLTSHTLGIFDFVDGSTAAINDLEGSLSRGRKDCDLVA